MPESAAAEVQKKPETFLHTTIVEVASEETVERTKRLLDVLNKIDVVQADKASRVSDFNAEIKQLNKEAHKLREAITTGKEKRDVECYEKPDERRNTVFIVRASDDKVLDERAMTLEDRMHLPGKSKADAKKEDAEANGTTSTDEASGSGGGTEEVDGKAGKAGKGGAGNVTRIRASDVKKRKAEREAKEAAEKAKKLADEQDAKNAAANDDESDDDSDEDDDA